MPANLERSEPLTVGEAEAVDVLFRKILDHTRPSDSQRQRLLEAVEWARRKYEGSVKDVEDREQRAFYHGLLTGYAVAMRLIEQEEQRPAR